MSQSSKQGSVKGRSSRKPSPLSQTVPPILDPDAPLPSIEIPAPDEATDVSVALSRLPFFSNFNDLPPTARFPNPVDVRNRKNFDRNESADLSRDPFETRALMNGLQIGQVWDMEYLPRPPFFDINPEEGPEYAAALMTKYFPGICPYTELRSPAGSLNLWGEHWGFLWMDLFDAEGMLMLREELRTRHVMALIKWQLLDFTDLVFLIGAPFNHDHVPYSGYRWKRLKDSQRFVVMPVHLPGHWALGIYHRDSKRLGVIDTLLNPFGGGKNFERIRDVCLKYLQAGLPNGEGSSGITVVEAKVTRQRSATNCGWHVANYVAFFFRQNRGKNDWEFDDWVNSTLCDRRPEGMTRETALEITWMFAIRSELNGTGKGVRAPTNAPVIKLNDYRDLRSKDGIKKILSQQQIIDMGREDKTIKHRPDLTVFKTTDMLMTGMINRFSRIDLVRPLDHRTSRKSTVPLPKGAKKLVLGDAPSAVIEMFKKRSLGLHRDLSKSPADLVLLDGQYTPKGSTALPDMGELAKLLEGPDMEFAEFFNPSGSGSSGAPRRNNRGDSQVRDTPPTLDSRHVAALNHNNSFQYLIDTSKATCWVPMPTVIPGFGGWSDQIQERVREINARPEPQEQVTARDLRAQRRIDRY